MLLNEQKCHGRDEDKEAGGHEKRKRFADVIHVPPLSCPSLQAL
jgi:hypothetical protein